MKVYAIIALCGAACYFTLFFVAPLTGFAIAYLLLAYFALEIVGASHILLTKPSAKETLTLSKDSMNMIVHCKENNINLEAVLHAGLNLNKMEDGEYTLLFVPTKKQELLGKIRNVINDHEGVSE